MHTRIKKSKGMLNTNPRRVVTLEIGRDQAQRIL